MSDKRELDTRDSIKVVTSNDFIMSKGLSEMPVKSRKLLYLAISQCKQSDRNFWEYTIPVVDFARLMQIDPSNVYHEAYDITDRLMSAHISIQKAGKKGFAHYNLTQTCFYDPSEGIRIRLNPDMTDVLLNLRGSFSQPLLKDFMTMKSPYSMAVWHLMQREMKSQKPGVFDSMQFYLSLDELREVTGTKDKLKQLVEFKRRVLDKAIREIRESCLTEITYEYVKSGRTVTGFNFTAIMSGFHVDESRISQEIRDRMDAFDAERKKTFLKSEKSEPDIIQEGLVDKRTHTIPGQYTFDFGPADSKEKETVIDIQAMPSRRRRRSRKKTEGKES